MVEPLAKMSMSAESDLAAIGTPLTQKEIIAVAARAIESVLGPTKK